MKKRGLGKGLDALLGGGAPAVAGGRGDDGGNTASQLSLNRLVAGAFQPRRHFPDDELKGLADSIRRHGVLQPIVVRPLSAEKFEIVAGERRFRAAKLLGLASIPAIVRRMSDAEAQLLALIENLQRADLNPMEQADGLARLIESGQLTHAQAGEKVGLSRPAVSNLLRLRELSAPVQALLAEGALEMGHARALLGVTAAQQKIIAKEIIRHGLTVRETEQRVRRLRTPSPTRQPAADADTRRLEKELSEKLSMPVAIRHRANGGGKLTVSYGSLDALDAVLKKLRKS